MSAPSRSGSYSGTGIPPKSKKSKKKKKSTTPKTEDNAESAAVNGPGPVLEDGEEVEVDEEELEDPTNHEDMPVEKSVAGSDASPRKSNGVSSEHSPPLPHDSGSETEQKLTALAKERDVLRNEVTELRKSLESLHEKHRAETAGLQEALETSRSGKDAAETQYRNLLGKVNTIKSQLGERLKADAEDLSRARAHIEELENENGKIKEDNESLSNRLAQLSKDNEEQASEVARLRERASLSQHNWLKERDDLISREAYAREEFETAKQAMQEWEVLATEERALRENLSDRVAELEEQVSTLKDSYIKASSERDSQSLTVDGLQRALQDIQDARKKELRELVERSQSQLEELRKQLKAAEDASAESKAALEATRKELERALPFEKEVKEKNLLIGKLRHEAVILNDHLTKALRFLKKGKPEDNVDKHIVTNHFLHFLALDRSDPKKFQVLQLIAALLNWDDEQREQAGLARPGASVGSLRLPMSPFRRTPSTPSLTTDMLPDSSHNKETLAELWSDFLEREAQDGADAARRPSEASHQVLTKPKT